VPEQFAGRARAAGEGGPADRDIPAGAPAKGIGGLQPGGLLGMAGRLRTRTAMLVVAASALIGILLSLAAGKDPGLLLGFFIIVGSIVAVLGIRRDSVYLVFPIPALTLFVSAIVVGKVHDAKLSSSTAGLGAAFLQWIASIFDPAVAATVLVALIGGGRWLLGRQLITGQSQLVGSRTATGSARPGRPGSDSWAGDSPFEDAPRSSRTGPAPRQGSRPQPQFDGVPNEKRPPRPPRDQRPAPDQRDGRDQWGEPGHPSDRERSLPPGNSRPPQPPGRPAQPRDGTGPRPPQPGPSWTPSNPRPPAPNGQRPRRPQPPDGWTR
jgi:hypothetical protein